MQDFTLPEFKQSGVYEIRNLLDNKLYVGSTTMSFQKRLTHHRSLLRKGTHKNPHLQRAWNKYGEHSFVFSVLEVVDVCCTLQAEQQHLDKSHLKYNINPFATGTPDLSAETLEKRTISFTKTIQAAMTMYRAIKADEMVLEDVPVKYYKLVKSRLDSVIWNTGLSKNEIDFSYLCVPKKKKGDRTQASINRRESEKNIFVYDCDFNFLAEFRSAKDIEEWSYGPENTFPIKSRFSGETRFGVPLKILQSVNIGKSCNTLGLYKNLYFRRDKIV